MSAPDYVLDYLLKHKIPVCQKNYLELAFMGDKTQVEELGEEEIAELPPGFSDWPVDEMAVH
jgi:hypothetical protein